MSKSNELKRFTVKWSINIEQESKVLAVNEEDMQNIIIKEVKDTIKREINKKRFSIKIVDVR